MAIANNSDLQTQHLKTRNQSQLEDVNKIKLAIEGMMLMLATVGSDNQSMGDASSPQVKKRTITQEEFSPSKKQRVTLTDDVLDQVAGEVSEVSEWELILANWNTEQENLPFSLLDSTLVRSL
ncbi:hypothetical protein MHU86_24368 [Fragilaria crotonensis]|nr:hypothetical protein MHU86_24368 [Fragilaria crotonensis]